MKRTVALILSVVMSVMMISSVAWAEEPAVEEAVVEEAIEEAAAEESVEEAAAEEAVAEEAAEEAAAEEAVDEEAAEEAVAEEAVVEEAVAEDGTSDGASSADAADYITVDVPLSEEGEILIEDYSVIEILSEAVAVEDYEIESYIQSIIDFATTSETITEGTVEDGDTVNINFSGVLEGEEEPFEGGTAENYDLVIGSGSFIPGFEDQIIGHGIGETFDIQVTFPEEYTEDLAGKNAVFTVTVNYKTVSNVPELTDEFVQKFSAENMETQLNSVDELHEYTTEYLTRNYIQNEIMTALQGKEEVVTYPEDKFNLMKEYSQESLDYYVAMYTSYGMAIDADSLANMSGYATADDYTSDESKYYLDMIMLIDKLAEDLGIEVTDEEVDETIADYMASYGYSDVYTVEEFKEMSGDAWVLLITTLNLKYEKVMEVLEERVVLIESAAEETVEDAVEEMVDEAEEAAEEAADAVEEAADAVEEAVEEAADAAEEAVEEAADAVEESAQDTAE